MTNLAHNLQATAGSHPHRVALRQGDVLFTYAQLNGEVARAAAWLADKGVRPGDRVAIMIPNVYAFPIFYYAILRSGAIVVPMNPLYKSREIEYYLGDSGAKLAIIWSESAGEASQAVSTLGVEMIEIDSGFKAMFGKHPDASHIAERFRVGLPPTSRSLNIGEQKRHNPRRRHPTGHPHRMSQSRLQRGQSQLTSETLVTRLFRDRAVRRHRRDYPGQATGSFSTRRRRDWSLESAT